ncbi:FAD-linked oxidase [Alicyclobacillus hesperidum subsp. aegles]|nr:FAD-linked oxidase [Alicyclobacillus hesperidum subsp. aegles]
MLLEEENRFALEQAVVGDVVFPEHPEYEARRKVWNGLFDPKPAVIVVCQNADDVSAAVQYANRQGLPVAVRGRGHHIAGYGSCDGGVLVDTSAMRDVLVDATTQTVKVACGVSAGEVIRATQTHGLAVPTGDVSKVGIAGLTLGGGMGYLRRKYGLTCDHLIEAEMVLANGQQVRVSATENAELFWAIRGGGGNFGIVTSFTFQARRIGPTVYGIRLMYSAADVETVLQGCREYLRTDRADVSFNIAIHTIPPLPHLPQHLIGQKVVSINGMHAGEDMELAALDSEPLRKLATPLLDLCGPIDYTDLHTHLDEQVPEGMPAYGRSIYLSTLDDPSIATIAQAVDTAPPTAMAMVWLLGGRMAEVPASETAFGARDAEALFIMEELVIPEPSDAVQKARVSSAWVDHVHRSLAEEQLSVATYLNMAGLEEQPEIVVRATYGANYARLSAIKREFDPDNVFRLNPNILPE